MTCTDMYDVDPSPTKHRTVCWFSCGAASAVAAGLAVETYPDCEIIYCDTFAYEHPDNRRFLEDVQSWIGRKIKILRSKEYSDIFDVFDRTGWLVGPAGARCSTELKKNVRKRYQRADDRHIYGLTADEMPRVKRFEQNNPELLLDWILVRHKLTKKDCLERIQDAGIELPAMYRLGYKNNNCIGCVKGQAGYWNKIRRDFPEVFERMARQERKMNVAINKRYEKGQRIRVFLDELDPSAGRYEEEPEISCGPQCELDLGAQAPE